VRKKQAKIKNAKFDTPEQKVESFQKADLSSLDVMADLIDACRLDLLAQGLFQWDEGYPSRAYLLESIERGQAHIIRKDDRLAGMVILNDWQHPSWQAIHWEIAGRNPLVIHSLAIHPDFQGQRLGSALLDACEKWAQANGYDSVRLDVFAENHAAVRLYRLHGYRMQGTLTVASKPPGHQLYDCYQKLL
jgi:ribosomal protein S18 acetylase RimI-like enzyme